MSAGAELLSIEIRRISTGPSLLIEAADRLALDFCRLDRSSAPGGFDDLAGQGKHDELTPADITAINSTMRARSPHSSWAQLTGGNTQAWLADLDPAWDLIELDEGLWREQACRAVQAALDVAVARGRGLSVATKVLHLKRPRLFPVLDSLVLQQLGATEAVPPIKVIDHLRNEGRRNIEALRTVQARLCNQYNRSLVRILDVLLWSSHPAAGLASELGGWRHVLRPQL